jgi:hypothetical protein
MAATTTNPGEPHPAPTPQPQPPRPAPQPQPQPSRPQPRPGEPPEETAAEFKARTDKEIAERVASPPEPPTPTQDEADAIKTGEYDASAPEGARVKRSMQPDQAQPRYPTR